MSGLSPESERAWRSLRRHLERSGFFTLVFLAVEEPSAFDEVCRRLSEHLTGQGAALEILSPMTRSSRWVESLEAVLIFDARRVENRSPVLLSLLLQGDSSSDEHLRDEVLVALNVQRSNLEQGFQRPLLIAVPKGALPRVWEVAPDLWTIRGLVVELGAARAVARGLSAGQAPPLIEGDLEEFEIPSVAEWRRVASRADSEPETVSPFLAIAAVEDAIDRGALKDAYEIAEEGLALARARAATQPTYERRSDVAALLGLLGEVLDELDQYDAAERAFVEALEVRLQFWDELGDQPVVLHDVLQAFDDLETSLRDHGKEQEAARLSAEADAARVSLEELRRRREGD